MYLCIDSSCATAHSRETINFACHSCGGGCGYVLYAIVQLKRKYYIHTVYNNNSKHPLLHRAQQVKTFIRIAFRHAFVLEFLFEIFFLFIHACFTHLN